MWHTVLQPFLDVSVSRTVGLNIHVCGLLLLQVYYDTESMNKLLNQIFVSQNMIFYYT